MTLIDVLLSWSRRQRTNVFKAALDAEYAGRGAAGTIARWMPVLPLSGKGPYLAMEIERTISSLSQSSCSSGMAKTWLSGPRRR